MRRKNKKYITIIAWLCVAGILHDDYQCYAFAAKKENPSAEAVQNSSIGLTRDKKDNAYSAENGVKPTVYLVQDAHCVPDIQHTIYSILNDLHANHGVSHVFVEGCTGIQDYAYLRLYPLNDKKKRILNEFLQRGIISGVEYFSALASMENQLNIVGLETLSLYNRNIYALRTLSDSKAEHEVLFELKSTMVKWFDEHGVRELAAALRRMELVSAAKLAGDIIVECELDGRSEILDSVPDLTAYYHAVWALSTLDINCVLSELTALQNDTQYLKKFSAVSPEQIRSKIRSLFADPLASHTADTDVLMMIEGKEPYSNAEEWIKCSREVNQSNLSEINAQIDRVIQLYLDALCDSEEHRTVLRFYRDTARLQQLLMLELSASESAALMEESLLEHIRAGAQNLPPVLRTKSVAVLSSLDAAVANAVDFYSCAAVRDCAMMNNFYAEYERLQGPCVLVLGGFHLDYFVQRFQAEKIPFIIRKPETSNMADSIEKKRYFQHFMTRFTGSEFIYNENSLAVEPVLSASGSGHSGPSAVWFNEVLAGLVDEIKPYPSLAAQWIAAFRNHIDFAADKIKNLIVLGTITAMLGMGGVAEAQEGNGTQLINPPGVVVQLTQDQLTQHILAYSRPVSVEQTQITQDILSGNSDLQNRAFHVLEERGTTGLLSDVFLGNDNDELRRTIISRLIATDNYTVLQILFQNITEKNAPEHLQKIRPLFDEMMLSSFSARPELLHNFQSSQDSNARHAMHILLAYYTQASTGSLRDALASVLVNSLDERELVALYLGYTDGLSRGNPVWQVMEPSQTTAFFRHGSTTLKNLAYKKLLESSVVPALEKIIRLNTKSKGLTNLLYSDLVEDARSLLVLHQEKNPAFLSAVEAVFPDIYQNSINEIQRDMDRIQQTISFNAPHEYPPLQPAGTLRVLRTANAQDASLAMIYLDRNASMGDWADVDAFIQSGADSRLRENALRQYYGSSVYKLVACYDKFDGIDPVMQDAVVSVLEKLFTANSRQYFPLAQYNEYINRGLILVARSQSAQNKEPSAWEYLLRSTETEYQLYRALHNTTFEGITLTEQEISDVQNELLVRFLRTSLQQRLQELSLSTTPAWFNPSEDNLLEIQEDLELLDARLLENPQTLIEKHRLHEEYTQWQNRSIDIQNRTYYRPSIVHKMIDVAKIPILTILGVIITLLTGFSLVRKKMKAEKTNGDSDSFAGKMHRAVTVVERFIEFSEEQITPAHADELQEAVHTLNGDMKYHVSLASTVELLEKIEVFYENTEHSKELREQLASIHQTIQRFHKSNKHKLILFEDESKQKSTQKATFKTLITHMLSMGNVRSQLISEMKKIINVEQFEKVYKSRRLKIQLYKTIALTAKFMFFGILIATPFSTVVSGFGFILMVLSLHALDVMMLYTLSRNYDEITKWFAFHLSRASKFDSRVEAQITAKSIADGEAALWATGQSVINFTGAVATMVFLSPWYILPYAVYMIFGILRWRSMIKQSDGSTSDTYYSPLYDIEHKVQNPAVAVAFGAVVETFIVTQLLEALTKTGSSKFVSGFRKAYQQAQISLNYLTGIIDDKKTVTRQTWEDNGKTVIRATTVFNRFNYNLITSNIVNGAQHPVVSDVTLSIGRGEMVYIDALPGMGKSTLGRMLALYRTPLSGSVSVETAGRDIQVTPQTVSHHLLRRFFKYLKFKDIPVLSAKQILLEAEKPTGEFIKIASKFIPGFKERYMDRDLGSLGFNEKKLLMLVLYAYINDPKFLVLDDMFSGLHIDTAEFIMDFLAYLSRERGITIVAIDTDIPKQIRNQFDTSYTLSAGKLISQKDHNELMLRLDREIEVEEKNGARKTLVQTVQSSGADKSSPLQKPAEKQVSPMDFFDDESPLFTQKTAEEAQEFSEPFKVSATVPIGSSSVPEPDFFDEAPPVSPQKEAVAERKSQSSVLDDYIKLLHTTARKSTTVERFNRNTPHDNLLTFIYAVLEQIKAYVSLKDPNQRMHMIRAYTQGTREQKIAAQIMRRTRKGTKTRFVNEIINYISYSDLADDFTVDTLTNNEVRELVKTEVLQRRLAQLLADVIMYVDVFGEEDIPHRMKLWRDYSLPDASPEQKIAAYIISKILEQQGSEYNITGKSFNDRKQALIHAVHYITGEKDLREQYDAVIRHTPVSEIVDLVTLELHNRRTELITEIQQKAPVIHGEKSSFNRSGRSLYELWGIVSLLKEYGVNDDLLPLALHGFSFKQLRNVLFGLRDAGVPITEQTLRMNLSLEGMPPQNSPVAPSDAERLDEEKQPIPPKPFMQFHHVFDWAA